MTTTTTNHILLDDRGVAWIDDTNVKVIEVATEYVAYRCSAEEMHRQHPNLSIAQIHAALAYYHDHKTQFDAQIKSDNEEFDQLWVANQDSPARQKLRNLGLL